MSPASASRWCPRCSLVFANFSTMAEHAAEAHKVQLRDNFGHLKDREEAQRERRTASR